jgi:hypothetical protein
MKISSDLMYCLYQKAERALFFIRTFDAFVNIRESSPYLTGSTLRLRYRAQPVNAVSGNSRCLL